MTALKCSGELMKRGQTVTRFLVTINADEFRTE